MELLGEIAREEDIKTSLSGDQEQSPRQPPVNFNSPDLKNLRERLLKEVVSSSNAQVIIEKPKVKTLFDTRPNLTANFLLPGADTPMSCLKGVPAMSQETLLLQELLGNGWQHIVPTRGSAGVTFSLLPVRGLAPI